MIPFLDVKAAYSELRDELDDALARVAASGTYIAGEEVEAFEAEYARYCGTAHAIAVGNGLDALVLALRAMQVGPGDEVVVPSNTFIATWLAVSHCGATPVPVEPDARTYNIDVSRIEAVISPRTKVILPVHLYGQPADLDPILHLASRYGVRVLEDAAQAHGGKYKGRRIGGHGDAATWSFYPGKNLGAMGDAGAVTTDDAELAARVRSLRNYGSTAKYIHEVKGFNSRMDPMHAAVLRVKLKYLDVWNARRAAVADRYLSALHGTRYTTPFIHHECESAWHLFVLGCPARDELQAHLAQRGIGTQVHYPVPPHEQAAYRDSGFAADSYPLASSLAREILSLPMGPHLQPQDQAAVIDALLEFGARRGE